MNDEQFDDRLEVFFGDASPAICRAYARLRNAPPEATRLAGSVTGPACLFARTLAARYPLVDAGPGESLLATAAIPEPSFWTPQTPHEYQIEVGLLGEAGVLATARRTLGIRTLGARGKHLYFEGKRFVVRGAILESVDHLDFEPWRETVTTIGTADPTEDFCREASRNGVFVIARLDSADERRLQRLARHSAVAVALLPRGATVTRQGAGANLLLAEQFGPREQLTPSPWAQIAICEVRSRDDLEAQLRGCPVPVIAMRRAGVQSKVDIARAACDRLQRDLAGCGPLAGYII